MAVLQLELLGDFRLRSESGALVNDLREEVAGHAGIPRRQAVAAGLTRQDGESALEQHRARTGAAESPSDPLDAAQRAGPGLAARSSSIEEGDFLSLDASLMSRRRRAEFESLVATGTAGSAGSCDAALRRRFPRRLPDRRRALRPVGDRRARPAASPGAARARAAGRTTQRASDAIDEAIADRTALAAHRSAAGTAAPDADEALPQSGDLLNALQQYDACARLLRRELDVEPDAETKAVQQEVLHLRKKRTTASPAERDARRTVLVVEDNVLNRELTNAVLKTARAITCFSQKTARKR
jgi:hypothetical protein